MYGLDLFSGIGGITKALEGYVEPIAYCENDRYATAVLLSRMSRGELPKAPIWDDIFTIGRQVVTRNIEIIYGGFPCQPFSVAGKRMGAIDTRNLWPQTYRCVEEFRPEFIFLENVPGLISASSAFCLHCWPRRWGGMYRDTSIRESILLPGSDNRHVREGEEALNGDSEDFRRHSLQATGQIEGMERSVVLAYWRGRGNSFLAPDPALSFIEKRTGETRDGAERIDSQTPNAEPTAQVMESRINALGFGDEIENAQAECERSKCSKCGRRLVFSRTRYVRYLDTILGNLAAAGYDYRWCVLSAAEVGANHRRERWWLLAHAMPSEQRRDERETETKENALAHTKSNGRRKRKLMGYGGLQQKDGSEESTVRGSRELSRDKEVADSTSQISHGLPFREVQAYPKPRQSGWWSVEPDVGRVAHGVPLRVDRLRGLGNAVVPAQAREAFERLMGLNAKI